MSPILTPRFNFALCVETRGLWRESKSDTKRTQIYGQRLRISPFSPFLIAICVRQAVMYNKKQAYKDFRSFFSAACDKSIKKLAASDYTAPAEKKEKS
jgi:hypothetical protein